MFTAISTPTAPAAIGPYSQGVDTGSMVFCSGQVPINPATGEIDTDDIAAQTEQVITNLSAVLTAAGLELSSVVKTTVFLTDIADFATVNQVYASHFTGDIAPARSTLQVAALPKGARVEMEAIAIR